MGNLKYNRGKCVSPMKKTIRYNTFETNSSSTHSVTVLTPQEFEQWRDNQYLLDMNHSDEDTPCFITHNDFKARWKQSYNRWKKWSTGTENNPDRQLDHYFAYSAVYSYEQFEEALNDIDDYYAHYGVRDAEITQNDDGNYVVSVTYRIS